MKSRWLIPALALAVPSVAFAAAAAKHAAPVADDDPYLWLEEVHGDKAMAWVRTHNAATTEELTADPGFDELRTQIREVYDSDARIPMITRRGGYLYNFWKDREHPRGLWRRTTLAEYRKPQPRWTVLLDVDALARSEKESWVWGGVTCLKPSHRRCMVALSRGGSDATGEREFDAETRAFVAGGFVLPAAKTQVGWKDGDSLYVGTDFGPGSMTHSGYPRLAKLWKRGTPLTAATLVFEGKPEDVGVTAFHDATPGFERDFVHRTIDTYTSELYLLGADGKPTLIDVPRDAGVDVQREWLTVQTRTPWQVGGQKYPAGALLATRLDAFLAGERAFTVLFAPTAHTSLASFAWTRHHLLLQTLEDVVGQMTVLTPQAGDWARQPLAGAPELSAISVADTDPDVSDEYFLVVNGYLAPESLQRGVVGEGPAETLKQAPSFFDPSGYAVQRRFATSKDGTRVPYFMVGPKNLKADGSHPTMLTGYGGFEISLTPHYLGDTGRVWLARGGVYVVANIRGGGEYGPGWHQAAIKQNRPRAYEDFAAVAADLIATKVTSPRHLGIAGGSNGGLLMGNMLARYPRLFGAVVSLAPLLDMKRYTHIAAGASWIAEFGDPDRPDEWAYIHGFSPYHNVKKGAKYPPLLLAGSTLDDRVGPGHARKLGARLLEQGHDVRFYENIEGGHKGAADNEQVAFMRALMFTFLSRNVR